MNFYTKTSLSLALLSTVSFANIGTYSQNGKIDKKNTYVDQNSGKEYKKTNKSTELDGDRPDRGWWFGFDETEEEKKKKKKSEESEKPLMSQMEKKAIQEEKNLGNLLKAMLVEMKKQTRLQTKILAKLEYAYPKTVPTYTINKKTGERCESNSSKDCFVMPVIAEGQQVPVLMNMLREPNKKNAEEYLKWQATYFNHVTDVAYSMKYAYNDKGKEAYPTDTIISRTSNISTLEQNARDLNESLKVYKLKENIGLMVFIDNPYLLKENQFILEYIKTGRGYSKNLNFMFVFKDLETEKIFNESIKYYSEQGYKPMVDNLKYQTIVKPETFKVKNIQISPSIILVYKDKKDKKKNFEQLIATGHISMSRLRDDITDALVYYKVLKPEDLSVQDNWNSMKEVKNISNKEKNNEK